MKFTFEEMIAFIERQIQKSESDTDRDMWDATLAIVKCQQLQAFDDEARNLSRQNLKQLYGMSRELTKGSVI